MRVPIRSAGTRSGVNWMRLNSPPIAPASVLMAMVFASPGTPSTSRWPRARSATASRSRRWSWPSMTFFTSYRTRSIGSDGGVSACSCTGLRLLCLTWAVSCVGCVLCWRPVEWPRPAVCRRSAGGLPAFGRWLVGRQAGRSAGHVDRHRKADPDEHVLVGGVDDTGHDPDDLAVAVDQWTAGIARIDGRIDLDHALDLGAVGEVEESIQAGDNSRADRSGQAEGIADDVDLAADLHAAWIAQYGRHELGRELVGVQDRDVVLRLRDRKS